MDRISVNLVVTDPRESLFFYRDVPGLQVHYADPDFAALEGFGLKLMLHADHTYDRMPLFQEISNQAPRGLGVVDFQPSKEGRSARPSVPHRSHANAFDKGDSLPLIPLQFYGCRPSGHMCANGPGVSRVRRLKPIQASITLVPSSRLARARTFSSSIWTVSLSRSW